MLLGEVNETTWGQQALRANGFLISTTTTALRRSTREFDFRFPLSRASFSYALFAFSSHGFFQLFHFSTVVMQPAACVLLLVRSAIELLNTQDDFWSERQWGGG